jgi:flagellar hook-length control protein FliK
MVMFKSSAVMNPFFLSSPPGPAGRGFTSGSKSAGPAGMPGENLFAMLLADKNSGQVFSGNSHAGNSLSAGSAGDHASVPAGGQKKGIDDGSAAAFLESVFLSLGISPDNVVLSRKDLDFLNNVLAEMGVSGSKRASFFKTMEETRSEGLITLNHFLKDLTAFEQKEIRTTDLVNPSLSKPLSLDKSAVPHLELMLRDLGLSPEKVDDLLSAASLKTGAIDIGKLVFQLKSRMHSNPLSPGPSSASNLTSAQMGNLKESPAGQYPAPMPEPPLTQRVASGLEKLGLSIPEKGPHKPVTLEMFIQALEKKIQAPVQVSRHMPMDAAQMAETVQEMPAVKAMKMEKADAYFGFAREMMIDGQDEQKKKEVISSLQESQKLSQITKKASRPYNPITFVTTKDTALRNQGHPRGDSRISAEDVPFKGSFYQADDGRQPVQMNSLKQDAEKTAAAPRADIDSRPMAAEFLKTDSGARQESHQTPMPGGDRVQGQSITFAAGAQNVPSPAKPLGVSQQGPLPAAVMNQVGKEIASFLQRGERIFTLQLKPPELGMVTIEMDVRENVLKMSVVAETSSAKDMLHASYVDLRRVLEGFGVRVESFDVQLSGNLNNHASTNGDGALNQQPNPHGRFGKNMQPGSQAGDTGGEDGIESTVMRQQGKDGLLDLLA